MESVRDARGYPVLLELPRRGSRGCALLSAMRDAAGRRGADLPNCGSRALAAGRAAASGDPVRRSLRLHAPVQHARRGGSASPAGPLLRTGRRRHLAAGRHHRQAHRRRGDGGVRRAGRLRQRYRAGIACREPHPREHGHAHPRIRAAARRARRHRQRRGRGGGHRQRRPPQLHDDGRRGEPCRAARRIGARRRNVHCRRCPSRAGARARRRTARLRPHPRAGARIAGVEIARAAGAGCRARHADRPRRRAAAISSDPRARRRGEFRRHGARVRGPGHGEDATGGGIPSAGSEQRIRAPRGGGPRFRRGAGTRRDSSNLLRRARRRRGCVGGGKARCAEPCDRRWHRRRRGRAVCRGPAGDSADPSGPLRSDGQRGADGWQAAHVGGGGRSHLRRNATAAPCRGRALGVRMGAFVPARACVVCAAAALHPAPDVAARRQRDHTGMARCRDDSFRFDAAGQRGRAGPGAHFPYRQS